MRKASIYSIQTQYEIPDRFTDTTVELDLIPNMEDLEMSWEHSQTVILDAMITVTLPIGVDFFKGNYVKVTHTEQGDKFLGKDESYWFIQEEIIADMANYKLKCRLDVFRTFPEFLERLEQSDIKAEVSRMHIDRYIKKLIPEDIWEGIPAHNAMVLNVDNIFFTGTDFQVTDTINSDYEVHNYTFGGIRDRKDETHIVELQGPHGTDQAGPSGTATLEADFRGYVLDNYSNGVFLHASITSDKFFSNVNLESYYESRGDFRSTTYNPSFIAPISSLYGWQNYDGTLGHPSTDTPIGLYNGHSGAFKEQEIIGSFMTPIPVVPNGDPSPYLIAGISTEPFDIVGVNDDGYIPYWFNWVYNREFINNENTDWHDNFGAPKLTSHTFMKDREMVLDWYGVWNTLNTYDNNKEELEIKLWHYYKFTMNTSFGHSWELNNNRAMFYERLYEKQQLGNIDFAYIIGFSVDDRVLKSFGIESEDRNKIMVSKLVPLTTDYAKQYLLQHAASIEVSRNTIKSQQVIGNTTGGLAVGASALAIGIGLFTANPAMVGYGVLGLGGSVAGVVNNNVSANNQKKAISATLEDSEAIKSPISNVDSGISNIEEEVIVWLQMNRPKPEIEAMLRDYYFKFGYEGKDFIRIDKFKTRDEFNFWQVENVEQIAAYGQFGKEFPNIVIKEFAFLFSQGVRLWHNTSTINYTTANMEITWQQFLDEEQAPYEQSDFTEGIGN